jgi:hypothetical protein
MSLEHNHVGPLLQFVELGVLPRSDATQLERRIHLLEHGGGDQGDVILTGEQARNVPRPDSRTRHSGTDRITGQDEDVGHASARRRFR